MPYGTANVDVIQSSVANTPVQFNDGNGTQVGTLCRAWVNYKGTATRAINASFNVSSVTYNSTGDYTVNFTNAMPDANYSPSCMGWRSGASNNGYLAWPAQLASGTPFATSSFRVQSGIPQSTSTNSSLVDADGVFVSIFR